MGLQGVPGRSGWAPPEVRQASVGLVFRNLTPLVREDRWGFPKGYGVPASLYPTRFPAEV